MSSKLVSKKTGFLIVLSAPSGCGKTTVVDRLLKRHSDWVRSVSMTTRVSRAGEKEGDDYFFTTLAEFEKLKKENALLESASVFGNQYGTPKKHVLDSIQAGKKVILAIDVQGGESIKKAMPDSQQRISIFILPPSVKVLRERLEGRNTESPEEIDRRIEAAQDEIKAASLYDFTIVNQNLEQTVREVEECIEKFEEQRRNK